MRWALGAAAGVAFYWVAAEAGGTRAIVRHVRTTLGIGEATVVLDGLLERQMNGE